MLASKSNLISDLYTDSVYLCLAYDFKVIVIDSNLGFDVRQWILRFTPISSQIHLDKLTVSKQLNDRFILQKHFEKAV